MKRLTIREKNVLTKNGGAYLFYIRENEMLKGRESHEVVNLSTLSDNLSNLYSRSEKQAVIAALCDMLDIKYTIDNLYGSPYVLNFWDKSGLNWLFTVKGEEDDVHIAGNKE